MTEQTIIQAGVLLFSKKVASHFMRHKFSKTFFGTSSSFFRCSWRQLINFLANFTNFRGKSFIPRGNSFRKPTLIPIMGMGIVFRGVVKKFKIIRMIINSISIYMMDSFNRCKISTNFFLHYKAMLQNTPSFSSKRVIWHRYSDITFFMMGKYNPRHNLIIQGGM